MAGGFEEFFEAATGGAPDAGQAATAVLPWLFRRLVDAPESTPRRLIYVLPANSLPEQVFARIRGWLDRLGRRDEVGTYLLAGAVRDGGWLRHPERTAILVGTHDLLLSRALMRGFADSQPGRRTLRQVRRAGRRRDGEQHSAGPAALHQRRNPRLATARLPGYRTGGSGGNTVTVTNPGVNTATPSGHDADGAAGKGGAMNRWYGGMVHELGHAFGLPDASFRHGHASIVPARAAGPSSRPEQPI